jgi:hypothetical protein
MNEIGAFEVKSCLRLGGKMNPGFLEVGLSEDQREVIINHPDLEPDENGCGHIVFSPAEARALARMLLAKAAECIDG